MSYPHQGTYLNVTEANINHKQVNITVRQCGICFKTALFYPTKIFPSFADDLSSARPTFHIHQLMVTCWFGAFSGLGFESGTPKLIIWSNYSDLTRPHSKWWFSKGNPLISGKSRLVKYYNLARIIPFIFGDSRNPTQTNNEAFAVKPC